MLRAALALSLGLAAPAQACLHDAMVVMDASASMERLVYGTDVTRMEDGRAAMRRALPRLTETRRIGLVTYGPGGSQSCDSVALRVPPTTDPAPLLAVIAETEPGGSTPLVSAVQHAAEALRYRTEAATIVLVTDGNDTCGGTPCAAGTRLAAEGADLTVHVIGFHYARHLSFIDRSSNGISYDSVARCLAVRTGGQYVTARDADGLVDALSRTLGCVLGGRARTGPVG
ncbi:VWA domain-containing protein [Jannaschia sp. Os4]|uniref:vWA domain-containing protein n=1 Tax=Jannaschia sp. Os4 TaxID=2807617 RepID=UPI001939AF50|nr:VWA domain-containing protein [Jannaschia sp. Os4]MBM2577114.1 VWA domain-containing protein [Jannaschia sp. Os4]